MFYFRLLWIVLCLTLTSSAFAQSDSAQEDVSDSEEEEQLDQSDEESTSDEERLEEEEEEEEPSLEDDLGERYEPQDQGPQTPRTLCHGRRIREIRVEGARRVEEDDIQATMQLRRSIPCTDEEVARGARALWELGYFDDIAIEAEPVGNEIELIIHVRERPAIARVVFEGNDNVDEEDIDEKVSLREGGILSIPDVQSQIVKIRDLYAEEGYFLARIDYEIHRLENDNNEVEVRFQIHEGEEVLIRRIRFVGNHHLPDDELNDIMQTSEEGFFTFLQDNAHYDEDAFSEDVNRLRAWYYDKGYLMVRVGTPRIELTPDREHIDITIPITEGNRFRVGEIQVREVDERGNEVEPLEDDLRSRIELNAGDWFSSTQIRLGLDSITRVYQDEGYALAEVNPEIQQDAERRIVSLNIGIVRGPPVRIERINIRGNSKTRDRVIRREMLILEGDLYNKTAIERSQARINALGYFERVDLSEESGSQPNRMVINIEIAERATGQFQVGAGFSSLELFLLTAQIQQQNLFGRGQTFALQLQLSSIRQNIDLRFLEPWFLDTQWSLGVDFFNRFQQFRDFTQHNLGAGTQFGHPIVDRRFRFSLGYRVERVRIGARTGGLFQSGGGGDLFDSYRRVPLANLFRDGLTSSLRFSLSWDSRDNRLFPSDGFYSVYSVELAERFLGSDQVFIRHTGFFRFYKKIAELGGPQRPLIFKVNTQFGLINSRLPQGVPFYERFTLGGIFNVRGYAFQSLGPRASIPRSTDPNATPPPAGGGLGEGVAIRGNFQLFYQAELEFPILPEIGIRGVVFSDGGNVWNLEDPLCEAPETASNDRSTNPCGIDLRGMRFSWGFGIRWFSPLGPLRFEWGIPFGRRRHEDKIRFEFNIGNSF